MCWFACIWRDSAGNHAYAHTTCACAAPYLIIYFCWQHLIKIDAQDPSNHFISNITLGFRRAVFCYRITAWWSLAGTSGDWLVQYHSSKQGQQKQLFGSALHNLSGQPVHSSATATVKKKRKSDVEIYFLVLSLCPLPPLVHTTEETLALSFPPPWSVSMHW